MRILLIVFCFMIAGFFGFQNQNKKLERTFGKTTSKEFPITQRKTFTFVIYAYNDAPWIQRTLQSIFEQEYDYYRIVFVDDGSKDDSYNKALSFIVDNNQSEKSLMIRNPEKIGFKSCLEQITKQTLDQEIIIPLEAKNWLSHNGVLTRLNTVFQNPDIWIASSQGMHYPIYQENSLGLQAFYSAIFKQKKQIVFSNEEKTIEITQNLHQDRHRRISDILMIRNKSMSE